MPVVKKFMDGKVGFSCFGDKERILKGREKVCPLYMLYSTKFTKKCVTTAGQMEAVARVAGTKMSP